MRPAYKAGPKDNFHFAEIVSTVSDCLNKIKQLILVKQQPQTT